MGDTMKANSSRSRRKQSRRRQRGYGVMEETLVIAGLMGCFVYPMSQAARTTGQQIAAQMESAHNTLLTQR
jgi:Tfp pilus assembly protein PilW